MDSKKKRKTKCVQCQDYVTIRYEILLLNNGKTSQGKNYILNVSKIRFKIYQVLPSMSHFCMHFGYFAISFIKDHKNYI